MKRRKQSSDELIAFQQEVARGQSVFFRIAKCRPAWMRFSLRTLLIFVTLFCIGLGINRLRIRAIRQREAVEKLKASHAVVLYDFETDDAGSELDPKIVQPPCPE